MIYAIIVIFNSNPKKIYNLIEALIGSGVIPVVVDNASIISTNLKCKTITLDDNYGIAKAQNIGVDYVLSQKPSAVIFFDQDSVITDSNFIDKLYRPILNNNAKITAPIFIDNVKGFTYPIVEITMNGGRVKHYPSITSDVFFVNNVISSGTMVEVGALKDIGKMLEPLFIDYVDTEWCLRADKKGFKVLIVPSARMFHSIGDKTLKIGRFYVPKHSPSRRYYRIRNSFYLLRLKHIPKLMAIREITFSVIHQSILILFSDGERLQYLRNLIKGCKDGVMGHFNK